MRVEMGRLLAWICAALVSAVPPALAQDDPALAQDDEEASDEESSGEETSEEDAEEPDEPPRWLAVVGGDVHTGTGSVLRGATVLCRNGKIAEIGYDLWHPEETEVLDVTGYDVYPGLVAVTSFGLFGGSSELADSVDPFNRNMMLALASGITTAVNGNEVGKLKFGEIEGVLLRENVFETFSYSTGSPGTKRKTRESFEAAAEYLRRYRKWEQDKKSDKDLKEPSKKGVDDKYVAVLRGEVRPVFSADDRTDLLETARLAQRFGFRPILRGAREAWTVADELGRAGASAVVTPRDRRSRGERFAREGGSSIENAAILHRAGVPVTLIPGSAGISLGGIVGRDLMHLTIEAGFAVRGGLPEDAALAGITIEPARLLGVDHRVGTLEVGKDADLIVTDGDLLHYQTFVQWTVVDGKLVYDKEAELYFAHIRPRPEGALAPQERTDAGETPPEDDAAGAVDEDEGDDDGDDDGGDG